MPASRRQTSNENRPVLALQVGHTRIRAIVFQTEGGEVVSARSLEERWQQGGLTIASPEGAHGLQVAIRKLMQQVPKNVDRAYLALSGEFCVTRVVNDTNENVLHEVREIESRSSLYLSLGHGPKVVAGSIIQQDPRHQHATVSVVHRQTVETILEVTRAVGLSVLSIEPTVISLCRLMGALKLDNETPALLVCPGQEGVEIAISYRGHLYLDYRPAAVRKQDEIADVLVHHLERLQRYCRRHSRVLDRAISSVYLSGERFRADAVQEQLGDRLKMPVRILETVVEDCPISPLLKDLPISHFPAAGVGLLAFKAHATPGPNLMERLKAETAEHLLPRVMQVLGPLAAMLVIAVGVWSLLLWQRWELQQSANEATALEVVRRETLLLQNSLTHSRKALNAHQQVAQQLPQLPVGSWMASIGKQVPEDAWLTAISLDSRKVLKIEGNSTREESIFEYADKLGQLPFVGRASIEGTVPSNTSVGPAIKFSIQCETNAWINPEESADDSV